MGSGPTWKEDEIAILQNLYSDTPNSELVRLFPGRTLTSIKCRASRLGLKKSAYMSEMGMALDGSIVGHLTEAERGYIAGLIDGEGNISLFRRKKSLPHKPVYVIQVSIANTSLPLMHWLSERISSNIYEIPRDGECNKTGYRFVISGSRRSMIFLREVLPYLVIKKRQAELLASGYQHLDENQRNVLYDEMRRLNKRGKPE